MKKQYSVARLIIDFFRDNKLFSAVLIFGGIFWAATFPMAPYLLGKIINQIKNTPNSQNIVFSLVALPATALVVTNLLRALNYYIFYRSMAEVLPKTKSKIILNLVSHLGRGSHGYFASNYTGKLTNKITNAINSFEPVIKALIMDLFPIMLLLLISGYLMFKVSPIFMVITLVWAASIISFTYYTSKKGSNLSYELAQAGSGANGKIVDFVTNVSSIICDATLKHELLHINPSVQKLIQKDKQTQLYNAKMRLAQGCITTACIACIMMGLLYGYNKNLVSVGDFAFVFTMIFKMANALHSLGSSIIDFYKNIGQLQEGVDLLNHDHEVIDNADAKEYKITRGEIVFANVYFQYDNKNKIFNNLNLHIASGKKIALIGRSGSGKSTLLKLLLRLYNVNSGSIRIDGIDITKHTLKSLRTQISLVPQDLTLFHRSVYENICHGIENVSEAQVIDAAKQAFCHDFIMQLPEQYQTQVGERGMKLSGGQKQRIVIARAMLKNTPILLLDEATSALDSETEELVQKAMDKLMQNKTVIVIAHRLTTLHAMDEIITLDINKTEE